MVINDTLGILGATYQDNFDMAHDLSERFEIPVKVYRHNRDTLRIDADGMAVFCSFSESSKGIKIISVEN